MAGNHSSGGEWWVVRWVVSVRVVSEWLSRRSQNLWSTFDEMGFLRIPAHKYAWRCSFLATQVTTFVPKMMIFELQMVVSTLILEHFCIFLKMRTNFPSEIPKISKNLQWAIKGYSLWFFTTFQFTNQRVLPLVWKLEMSEWWVSGCQK